VEPMAVVTGPGHVSTQHQKLLHLVAESPWSNDQMLAKVREQVVPSMAQRGPIEAWIIDDTGFPKKGTHSADRPELRSAARLAPVARDKAARIGPSRRALEEDGLRGGRRGQRQTSQKLGG